MIEIVVACVIAALLVEAASAVAVYKYAKRDMVSKSEYGDAVDRSDAKSKTISAQISEISALKEHLAQRGRKIELMEADYQELDRKFNESVTKQALDTVTISDLVSENLKLKEELALKMATAKKRSGKIG